MSTSAKTNNAKPVKLASGLDLDELVAEIEAGAREPFTFTIGGETFTTIDPQTIDYQYVAEIDFNDYRQVMEAYLGEEQWERFAKFKVAQRAVGRLIEAISDHYPNLNSGE